jgi:6-pyruvoyl-tetrahydropterin synthase
MRTELILKRALLASHSLDTREEPHPHLFKLEFVFTGEAMRGRIIDLPVLEQAVDALIEPLQNRYLNDCSLLPEPARHFPTCETLGSTFIEWTKGRLLPQFKDANPTLTLVSVMVTLCEPDGREYGAARTYP